MMDGHIHIERGKYTLEWIEQFVNHAMEKRLQEIRLLEHNYIFEEFSSMYVSVCSYSEYVDAWFKRSSGKHKLEEYLRLIDKVRKQNYPIDIKFGLEVCYFKEYEELIEKLTNNVGFDFLLGSVHSVDDFAFDHTAEHWKGVDVDKIYRRYYEDSISMAKSGLFDGIGHPDSIKMFGHKPSFYLTEYYERLAKELFMNGMYADQNSGAARRCPETSELGINNEFLHVLKENNVNIITSSDAHCPEDVGYLISELEECIKNA